MNCPRCERPMVPGPDEVEYCPSCIFKSPVEKVRATALLLYTDPEYTPPTPAEVRMLLKDMELTGKRAAEIVGVSSGRTIRKWTGGTTVIPYSAWRLLLLEKWFYANAANLATHRIGGYHFDG